MSVLPTSTRPRNGKTAVEALQGRERMATVARENVLF